MKSILKLGLVLALFSTAACVGLALVYASTERIIAQRTQADLEAALKELFPEGDGFAEIEGSLASGDASVRFESAYRITRGGAILGVALRAVRGSYGGPLTALVGVGADGRISRIKILDHSDTPGLGANAASPAYFVDRARGITFSGQFDGKSVGDPFAVKGDVAAITAATITSRAVAAAVQASGRAASAWIASQGGSQ